MIEHGVCQGLLGDGSDLSGYAEADLMDGIKGLIIKDRLRCAGKLEMMCHIKFRLLQGERGHMVPHGDPLIKGLHNGEIHDSSQIGLSGEHEDKGIVGVHFEVGEETKFLQRPGL